MIIPAMKREIEVRFRFEGIHCYPDAPEEVEFLRKKHRHEFHVRVRMDVAHDDRELEFLIVKRKIQNFIYGWSFDLGSRSCEVMAREIAEMIITRLHRISVEVEVNEDGENGAIVSCTTREPLLR